MSETLSFEVALQKKKTKLAWSAFFANLASAQSAVADECRWLANDLELEGRYDLADHYRIFESEERAHAASLEALCTDRTRGVARSKRIYSKKVVGHAHDNIEKMAILHFSLDPSFLTFLGSIHRDAETLFGDHARAEVIRSRLAPIVRDEVFHVNEGQEMTLELVRSCTNEAKLKLKARLATHQKLVARAFARLFIGTSVPSTWLNEMNENYRVRFERSVNSLLN